MHKLGFAVRLTFWESLSNSICMWFKLVLCSQKVNYIISPAYVKQRKIINLGALSLIKRDKISLYRIYVFHVQSVT
jgi:hypothetical protein